MQFSPQQDKAMKSVAKWLADEKSPQIFRLFGYAGTGKTTLAQYLAQDVSGEVMFGAFTGKAAHVLKTKGCPNASTLHSMIYIPADKDRRRLQALEEREADLKAMIEESGDPTGKLNAELVRLAWPLAQEKRNVESPHFHLNTESAVRMASLIVIDEVSMVNEQMAEDLLSFGTKVLVLGDPAQLPPVKGGGYFTECEPDIMLTEIHRQAKENPIIYLATEVREGRKLHVGEYGSSVISPSFDLDDMMAADQVLTGRNKTRIGCNRRIRKAKGFQTPDPVPGDRVVCLKNNHQEGLLNGGLWDVLEVTGNRVDPMIKTMHLQSVDDGEQRVLVDAFMHLFHEKELPSNLRVGAEQFDYGYALTVHKAQGSQWPKVLVIDESSCFRENSDRWLYTAITRAAESVHMVQP